MVCRPDELKGTVLVAFFTQNQGIVLTPEPKKELCAHVSKEIGAIARPDEIRFAEDLPKTRSGMLMHWLLRDVAGASRPQATSPRFLRTSTPSRPCSVTWSRSRHSDWAWPRRAGVATR
ncbi:MAG TPA: hypothetical protein VEZ71_09600 [Archangium sp.]|nr:hypothetical protein [Archangium sp.]